MSKKGHHKRYFGLAGLEQVCRKAVLAGLVVSGAQSVPFNFHESLIFFGTKEQVDTFCNNFSDDPGCAVDIKTRRPRYCLAHAKVLTKENWIKTEADVNKIFEKAK